MIETHTIRLRGPWECEINDGTPRRIRMPASWQTVITEDNRGRLRCRRRFGCPTCLDPHERVWMVIDRPALACEATLNGDRLGSIGPQAPTTQFDITSRLTERNELEIDFDLPVRAAGSDPQSPKGANELLFADVRLEIRG